MQEIKLKLESVFRRIEQQHMRDVPVCNPELQVEAVGFRQWGDYYLGVMVTPWFMNLMLLPVRPEEFEISKEGSKQVHIFPSGRYEFISGKEDHLGAYQVCSLFSPMHEFTDQQTAVETAQKVLVEVMDARNRDDATMNAAPENLPTQPSEPRNNTDRSNTDRNSPDASISRRDFLRGGGILDREHIHGERRGD